MRRNLKVNPQKNKEESPRQRKRGLASCKSINHDFPEDILS